MRELEFPFDIGIYFGIGLPAFMALGFLRARKGWRVFAMVVLVIYSTACLAGAAYVSYLLAIGTVTRNTRFFGVPLNDFRVFGAHTVRNLHFLFLAFSVLVAVLSLILLLILMKPTVRGWFTERSYLRVTITPSAKLMLILVTCLGLVPAALAQLPHYLFPRPVDTAEYTSSRNERSLCVAYGYRFGRLAYVLFMEKPFGESMSIPIHSWTGGEGPWSHDPTELERPDGKTIALPNATQLYEIVDGEFRTSPAHVTREQFETFLGSDPDRLTIDALLAFADAHASPSPEANRPRQ